MRRTFTGSLLLDRLGLLALILLMAGGGLLSATGGLNNGTTPAASGSTTPTAPPAPTVVFPTVPSGGTVVIPDGLYIHPSGLFSLPHLLGWNQAPSAEQANLPTGSSPVTEMGNTFINSTLLSVVHSYINNDPTRKIANSQDLDRYWDKTQLDSAWRNFTGGYKELNRRVNSDGLSTINFELYLEGNTYLGRQLAQMQDNWMLVLRLVVPNNNPDLLDKLQAIIIPRYHLWIQEVAIPSDWQSIVDPVDGYVVRLTPTWKVNDGSSGKPFLATGTAGPYNFTLTTRADEGSVKSQDDVKNWLKANIPAASILTIKEEKRNDLTGFTASYSNPDADGNKRSGVVTLLSGTGRVYTLNFQSTARELNLLDDATVKTVPELEQIRGTFLDIPADQLIPTLTPSPTFTPPPTLAPGTGTATTSP
ncbi:MAG TPA: hypothetical protein VMT34_00640 [Aggregatilineales bacterium]|nr:hypothetical protein [Aggregatilineales bacterium]